MQLPRPLPAPGRIPGLLLACACSVVLWGCAAPPPPAAPSTTVVLLPDEDGHVGAVSVSGASGSRRLEQAFSYATVGGPQAQVSDPRAMGEQSVEVEFGQLLKAQPSKPKTFLLYFVLGKTELTAESKALLPEVLAAARARKPTEISVFGHADAIGSDARNVRLSAERAELVARLLRASDPSLGKIEVRWFGARSPLLQPDAHGAQPRNRRAEVMIL